MKLTVSRGFPPNAAKFHDLVVVDAPQFATER